MYRIVNTNTIDIVSPFPTAHMGYSMSIVLETLSDTANVYSDHVCLDHFPISTGKCVPCQRELWKGLGPSPQKNYNNPSLPHKNKCIFAEACCLTSPTLCGLAAGYTPTCASAPSVMICREDAVVPYCPSLPLASSFSAKTLPPLSNTVLWTLL